MLLESVGCMVVIRFRAQRSVLTRGERGKFASCEILLSVKSKASWSCIIHNLQSVAVDMQD